QVEKRGIKGLHAEIFRFLHHFLDAINFSAKNQFRHQRCAEKNFNGGAAFAIGGGNQPLGDKGLEVEGQIHQQLMAALFGKEVDDAIQRLIGVVGMEGGN